MNTIIEDYYKQADTLPFLLERKMSRLRENPDIMEEFANWIQHREYRQDGVSVEGYTARDLAELSPYTDGEPAFMLLLDLREAPERTLRKIREGFKIK